MVRVIIPDLELTCHNTITVLRKRFKLILSRIYLYGSYERYPLLDIFCDRLTVGYASCQDDGIDLSIYNCRKCSYVLCNRNAISLDEGIHGGNERGLCKYGRVFRGI